MPDVSEMSDAEWLRHVAATRELQLSRGLYMAFGLSKRQVDRLRSIAARLERPGVEGVVFEVGYADMWGVEVQIEYERLAEILGGDPKARQEVRVTIEPVVE